MNLLFRVPIMCVAILSIIFYIVLDNFIWEPIMTNKLELHPLFTIILIIVMICNMIFFCGMIDFCLRG